MKAVEGGSLTTAFFMNLTHEGSQTSLKRAETVILRDVAPKDFSQSLIKGRDSSPSGSE